MTEVLRCDGPDCGKLSDGPALGWWSLENESLIVVYGAEVGPFHFCSFECAGRFVLDRAGGMAELEQQLSE